MLTENEIVIAMCAWLRDHGYRINGQKLDTNAGHDIEAERDGRKIYVECKGGKSKKTGASFGIDYQWRAAAGAFFNQMCVREKDRTAEVGIALPDGGRYPELMKDLKGFCENAGIKVFWVSESGAVREWQSA